jgi:hypothetical protein
MRAFGVSSVIMGIGIIAITPWFSRSFARANQAMAQRKPALYTFPLLWLYTREWFLRLCGILGGAVFLTMGSLAMAGLVR